MLRTEIVSSVSKIVQTLRPVQIIIERMMTGPSERLDKEVVLQCFLDYKTIADQFNLAENTIINLLEIDYLLSVKFWSTMIGKESEKELPIRKVYNDVKFATRYLPKLIEMLVRDTEKIEPSKKKDEIIEDRRIEKLSVTVIEDSNLSSPKRLVLMLNAIEGLYEAAAEILNKKTISICVVSCDSGSDKSFDFLGAAQVMGCVKEIILSLWDRIVFFRENKTSKQLELIANSLPILDKIKEMKDNEKLSPEKAELLNRKIISSVIMFSDAGVTIPEIQESTTFNPRLLMQPEQKLLVASTTMADQSPKTEEQKEAKKNQESKAKKKVKRKQNKKPQEFDINRNDNFENLREPE